MNQSIYQFVIDSLQDMKGSWPVVANETGISKRTIEKIARKEIDDPGVKTVERLAAYFKKKKGKR